jgi:hypothetical protein
MNWTYMGTAIVLSEYYFITKKSWVVPELEKIRDLLYEGQYLDMSQINPKVKESHPDSYPTGPKQSHGGWGHNPGFEGYGPIAMITAQGALTYSLMHRCGIEIDRKRHDAAYEFLKRGTGENGYLWYGDSRGGGPTTGRTWAGPVPLASPSSPAPIPKTHTAGKPFDIRTSSASIRKAFRTPTARRPWAWLTRRWRPISNPRTSAS